MSKPRLICPSCSGQLIPIEADSLNCSSCSEEFPIKNGVPLLLSASNCLFSNKDSLDVSNSGFSTGTSVLISKYLPVITFNKFQDDALKEFISGLEPSSKCLIIGAGNDNTLKQQILTQKCDVVATDVIRTDIVDFVCDSGALPFADSEFDAAFIIAVLEHVVDPISAVSEISRVLRKDGYVFSAIPFMQQVHMGCFDFQRYTLLGHRWLYSSFELVRLAPSSGAGSALLWSITSFLQSFTKSRLGSLISKVVVRVFLFWIKYFDLLQRNIPDYALGTFFVGKNKKKVVITEAKLIGLYSLGSKGAVGE